MKKFFAILGMLVGLATIALGIYLFTEVHSYYLGDRTSGYTFGADYYTEQYAATKNASENIRKLGELMEDIVHDKNSVSGIFVMLFGGFILCYFGCILFDNEKKKAPEVVQAYAPVQPVCNPTQEEN